MEEKKKVNLITALLVLIVIMLITVASLMYVEIQSTKAEMKELKERITNLEPEEKDEEIEENQDNNAELEKENKYKEITAELDGIDVLYVTNAINNNNGTYTLRGVIYTQYTLSQDELNKIRDDGKMQIGDEIFTLKNGDKGDELHDKNGLRYNIIRMNSEEYYLETNADISDVWKLTDEYREITVENDVVCDDGYIDTQLTVEEVFENYEDSEVEDSTCPLNARTYTFEFKDGKCVKVIDYLTSM